MGANYDSIVARMNRAIKKAETKGQPSAVHLVEEGTDTESLSGLIIILNRRKYKHAETAPIINSSQT